MRASVKALTLWNIGAPIVGLSFVIACTSPHGRGPLDDLVVAGFILLAAWLLYLPITTVFAVVLNHLRAQVPWLTVVNLTLGSLWIPILVSLVSLTYLVA